MLDRTRDSRGSSVTQGFLNHSKTIRESTLIGATIASFHTTPIQQPQLIMKIEVL